MLQNSRNETELDDTGGEAETVETLVETFGMYRSTLPAPASQWGHDVALLELHMTAATTLNLVVARVVRGGYIAKGISLSAHL